MALASKTFNFASGPDNFQFPADFGDFDMGWDSVIKALRVYYNFGGGSGATEPDSNYMYWQGNWEDLNVPGGSTVTHLQLALETSKVDQVNAADTLTVGPIELWQKDGPKQFTLLSGRSTSTPDSTWVAASGALEAVDSSISYASSEIEIRIYTSTSDGYFSESHHDHIILESTYATPIGAVGDIPLYMFASVEETQGKLLNLYLSSSSISEISDAIPLVLKVEGEEEESNSLNLYLHQLGTSPGGDVSTAGGAVCTLFMNGQIPDIYDISEHLDLLTLGHTSISGIQPLVVYMDSLTAETLPLYISGPTPSMSEITLFLKGGSDINRSTNLFLMGPDLPVANDDLTLFLYGSPSGVAGWIPGTPGTVVDSLVNLYLECSIAGEVDLLYKYLNFYLKANIEDPDEEPPIEELINVAMGYKRLFIKGAGIAPGYYPINHTLNLIIEGS